MSKMYCYLCMIVMKWRDTQPQQGANGTVLMDKYVCERCGHVHYEPIGGDDEDAS